MTPAEGTGDLYVSMRIARHVLRHGENQGVGSAMVTGYRRALEVGADIAVKIDGDGQMDPALLPAFVRPLALGLADYTKGNRFFSLGSVRGMPFSRLLGNAALSLLTKLSTGYWRTFDPSNGYRGSDCTVIAASASPNWGPLLVLRIKFRTGWERSTTRSWMCQ